MFSIIGIGLLFVCVFGGYIMAGGKMAPIIKAAPIETFIIGGAAVAAMLVGNSLDIVKGAFGGIPFPIPKSGKEIVANNEARPEWCGKVAEAKR